MSKIDADRSLLFGLLAHQTGFIGRDTLIAAMNAWALDKGTPLGEVLVARGALDPRDRDLLESMLDRHVQLHGGDPSRSLAALGPAMSAREALRSVADRDVQASLGHLEAARGEPPPQAFHPLVPATLVVVAVLAILTAALVNAARQRAEAQRAQAVKQSGLAERRRQEASNQAGLAEQRRQEAGRQAGLAEERRRKADAQRSLADRRRHEAERDLARLAMDRGLSLCARGDSGLGILWLARSLRIAPADATDLQHAIRTNLDAWGRQSPRLLGYLEGTSERLAAFSPDGRTLASTHDDKTVWLWDVAGARRIGPAFPHQSSVLALAFSPDGRTLATGSGDNSARLWDVATGSPVGPPLTGIGIVRAVAFSPDGRTIAAGGDDKAAQLWEVANARPIGPALPHPGPVDAVAFSPDGRTLLSRTRIPRPTARLWDVATGKPLDLALRRPGPVDAVAFSPDGRTLATWDDDRTVRLWERATGMPTGSPLRHRSLVDPVDFAFSPDGRTLATSSTADAAARLWDVATGVPVGPPLPHLKVVGAVAFSPDGRTLATSSRDLDVKGTRLRDVSAVRPIHTPLPHPAPVVSVAFSPDGHTLATATPRNVHAMTSVRLWDLATARPVGLPIETPGDTVEKVAFSPDGRALATSHPGGPVRLWDLTTGKPAGPPLAGRGIVRALAFGPEGQILDKDGPGTIGGGWSAVAVSPDGRTLATGWSGRYTKLWDVATGMQVGRINAEGVVHALAFSPDGRTLAASDAMAVQLHDAAGARPIGPAFPHQDSVEALAFSPDGRTLAAGLADATAWLWDVATGKPVGPPLPHRGPVRALAFSPDGRALVTGDDSTARLWVVPTPVAGDVERVDLWAQVLTGIRLDEGEVARTLAFRPGWEPLHSRLERLGPPPIQRDSSPESTTAWHRREAVASHQAGQWFAADWHLDRLISALPEDGSAYALRGDLLLQRERWVEAEDAYGDALRRGAARDEPTLFLTRGDLRARLGRWADAASDFARTIAIDPVNPRLRSALAYAELRSGRDERYRDQRRMMLQLVGDSPLGSSSFADEGVIVCCLTAPDRGDDLARGADLVARGLPRADGSPWMLYCAGLADYRCGRYASALDHLRLGRNANRPSPEHLFVACMSLGQSMACARLQRKAEARKALAQAESILAAQLPGRDAVLRYPCDWQGWVHCEILHREAVAEVAALDFPADPFVP